MPAAFVGASKTHCGIAYYSWSSPSFLYFLARITPEIGIVQRCTLQEETDQQIYSSEYEYPPRAPDDQQIEIVSAQCSSARCSRAPLDSGSNSCPFDPSQSNTDFLDNHVQMRATHAGKTPNFSKHSSKTHRISRRAPQRHCIPQ